MVDQGLEGHIPLSALRPMYRALAAVNAAVGLDETLQAIADQLELSVGMVHNLVRQALGHCARSLTDDGQ